MSPTAASDLNLSDIERSKSRLLGVWNLISCKIAEFGHVTG